MVNDHLDLIVKIIHTYESNDWDGEANYAMSYLVAETFAPFQKWRYHFIARAVAAFECAKLEFYRRVAAPVEDKAIEKNGDIRPYSEVEYG